MNANDEKLYGLDSVSRDLDLDVTFRLIRSADHAGYALAVSAGQADPIVVGEHIPTVDAGLSALAQSLTAPLVSEERVSMLEDAVSVISALMDRVAELETHEAAILDQVAETRNAMIQLLAGGNLPVHNAPVTTGPPAPSRRPQPPAPGFVEEGFAGTFRRPLVESVHAGPGRFPGGAFSRGGRTAQQVLGPEAPDE